MFLKKEVQVVIMGENEYKKTFTISSTMEGLKQCLEVTREIQDIFKFDTAKEFAFQTVMIESVNNAIIHGNKFNADLQATITILVDKDHIKIEVEDQGEGFDLERIPSAIEKERIGLENGRGIFFIRQLSDGFMTRGKGNIVDIVINR